MHVCKEYIMGRVKHPPFLGSKVDEVNKSGVNLCGVVKQRGVGELMWVK